MTPIQKGIRQLVQKRTLSPDLFEAIVKIAGAQLRNARANKLQSDVTDEEYAGDFVVALAGEEINSEITSLYQLSREFTRWLTRRDAPEQTELWQVLSETMLTLERAGRVERPLSQRRFYNNNKTPWYLPGNQDAKINWAAEDAIADQLPSPKRKSARDRILKPDEAAEMILIVLRVLSGPIPFNVIFQNIRKKLPLLSMDAKLEAPIPGAQGKSPRSLQEIVESRDVMVCHEMMVAEQVAASAAGIWEGAGKIQRGGKEKIEGRQILCCYLIPRCVGGQKVTLENFGPTSTVQDLVTDLESLLREWLSDLGSGTSSSVQEEYLSLAITRGVLEKIGALCSENGHCRSFYSEWNKEPPLHGHGGCT